MEVHCGIALQVTPSSEVVGAKEVGTSENVIASGVLKVWMGWPVESRTVTLIALELDPNVPVPGAVAGDTTTLAGTAPPGTAVSARAGRETEAVTVEAPLVAGGA